MADELLLLLRVDADEHGAMFPACLSSSLAIHRVVEELVAVVVELMPIFAPRQLRWKQFRKFIGVSEGLILFDLIN